MIIDRRNLGRLAQPCQQPGAAAGVTIDADALPATRPRHSAVFFLHRFSSAHNRHVHLHLCATDGVFVPNGDGRPAFLPAHPITEAHLVTLTERVRPREIRWFRLVHLLDASTVAAMCAWENSGFSIEESVRIASTASNCVSLVSPWSTCCGIAPAAVCAGATLGDSCCERIGGCCDGNQKARSHDTSRIGWARLMARTIAMLDDLQDRERQGGSFVEVIFHPVPSVQSLLRGPVPQEQEAAGMPPVQRCI